MKMSKPAAHAYCITICDAKGKVYRRFDLEGYDDDKSAVAAADGFIVPLGHAKEVWDGRRLIKRVES